MFRPDDHYYLLQAFDCLGRHLYGERWSGYEYRAQPISAPELVEHERAGIRKQVAELDARQAAIRDDIRRTVNAARIEALQTEEQEVIDQRTGWNEKLHQIYTVDDSYRQRYAAIRAELTRNKSCSTR